eukprot:TRINITY_DN25198_c0_g1_i3.p2 TRINITY_DN25198_c0_g1~~TRINITY_DN25198_c0_g1_i3.p2  ORF type:complete len:185 (+),score=59.09 TRINITY_DN25198_c0_g1_i3:158-712(+)
MCIRDRAKISALERQNRLSEERYAKELADTQDMVAAQERMSNKWRDESRQMSTRFERTVKELQDDNSRLRARLDELTGSNASLCSELSVAQSDRQDLQRDMEVLAARTRSSEQNCRELQRRVADMFEVKAELLQSRTELESANDLSLIHISEPTRLLSISYAVFCLKKKKKKGEIGDSDNMVGV